MGAPRAGTGTVFPGRRAARVAPAKRAIWACTRWAEGTFQVEGRRCVWWDREHALRLGDARCRSAAAILLSGAWGGRGWGRAVIGSCTLWPGVPLPGVHSRELNTRRRRNRRTEVPRGAEHNGPEREQRDVHAWRTDRPPAPRPHRCLFPPRSPPLLSSLRPALLHGPAFPQPSRLSLQATFPFPRTPACVLPRRPPEDGTCLLERFPPTRF